jgi:hypothetical protein
MDCDNTIAVGIINDTIRQRRSKAMDMRFYWIKDRQKRGLKTGAVRAASRKLYSTTSPHAILTSCHACTMIRGEIMLVTLY